MFPSSEFNNSPREKKTRYNVKCRTNIFLNIVAFRVVEVTHVSNQACSFLSKSSRGATPIVRRAPCGLPKYYIRTLCTNSKFGDPVWTQSSNFVWTLWCAFA